MLHKLYIIGMSVWSEILFIGNDIKGHTILKTSLYTLNKTSQV